jgi:hypothetical protein
MQNSLSVKKLDEMVAGVGLSRTKPLPRPAQKLGMSASSARNATNRLNVHEITVIHKPYDTDREEETKFCKLVLS